MEAVVVEMIVEAEVVKVGVVVVARQIQDREKQENLVIVTAQLKVMGVLKK